MPCRPIAPYCNLDAEHEFLTGHARTRPFDSGPPFPAAQNGWMGTSIGLDRPLYQLLAAVRAAVDPSGAVLGATWSPLSQQPCAAAGALVPRPGYNTAGFLVRPCRGGRVMKGGGG